MSNKIIRVAGDTELDSERVGHTLVHAAKTWMPEDFRDYHADEAAQDNSDTPNSMM